MSNTAVKAPSPGPASGGRSLGVLLVALVALLGFVWLLSTGALGARGSSPSAPESSSAPATSAAAAPSGDAEKNFTAELLRNPAVTLKDPDRLVRLGNGLCGFWEEAGRNPRPLEETYLSLLQWYDQQGVSRADGRIVNAAAVHQLCPQYRSQMVGK